MSRIKNLQLILKYPFLLCRNRFTDSPINFKAAIRNLMRGDFKWAWFSIDILGVTELDSMPDGWRNKFGEQMCEDIKQALLKAGGKKLLHEFRIEQIKEKFGSLRFYCNFENDEIRDIIRYYEELSMCYCINCGKPVRYVTGGWISYLCEDCFNKHLERIDKDDKEAYKKQCRLY